MEIKIGTNLNESLAIPMYFDSKKNYFFNETKQKRLKEEIEKKLKFFKFEAKKENLIQIEVNSKRIIIYSINKDYTNEDLRRVSNLLFKEIKKTKISTICIEIPKNNSDEVQSIVEGFELSNYKFDKYLKSEKEDSLNIFLDTDEKYNSIVKEAQLICRNVKQVRNLVFDNSSVITPDKIAKQVNEFAKKKKLKCKILNEKLIEKEKLNLLKAVGEGSVNKPRLIIVEYFGNPKSKEITALVGKGITFDTGGYNIKPTGYIEEMRMDMAGAATMFGTFMSAVELKLKKNIILVLPCAENSVSSNSYKPGDIFISHKKISVEIKNTDAEGRLVLADAISYVQSKYKITNLIDMATLTGACLVALGPTLIALMSNDSKLKKDLFESGEKTFERVWELPIYDEHRDLIKGKISDITNSGGRDGGTITAGAFLEKFIDKEVKWAHLDIAGAAMTKSDKYYISSPASGVGLRLMIEYLRNN